MKSHPQNIPIPTTVDEREEAVTSYETMVTRVVVGSLKNC